MKRTSVNGTERKITFMQRKLVEKIQKASILHNEKKASEEILPKLNVLLCVNVCWGKCITKDFEVT
jgi:hypothetical protein